MHEVSVVNGQLAHLVPANQRRGGRRRQLNRDRIGRHRHNLRNVAGLQRYVDGAARIHIKLDVRKDGFLEARRLDRHRVDSNRKVRERILTHVAGSGGADDNLFLLILNRDGCTFHNRTTGVFDRAVEGACVVLAEGRTGQAQANGQAQERDSTRHL